MIYRSIVISGPVAAGTTTAAKELAGQFNLEYHSAGDFFRQYMLENNIPLPNKGEIPDEVDRQVDEELTKLAQSEKGVVIDALYHGYFTRNMPLVLKVLLTADPKVRVQRVLSRVHTHKETEADIVKRDREHDLKFRKLYADEDFLDPKFFDLAIDTTNTKQEEVVEKIANRFVGK